MKYKDAVQQGVMERLAEIQSTYFEECTLLEVIGHMIFILEQFEED